MQILVLCYLLALSVGQRLCIDFSVPVPANFLTTLRSHMDVTCSCYFWSSLRMSVVYTTVVVFIIRKDRASRFHRFLVKFVSAIELASDTLLLCSYAVCRVD